MSKWIPVSKRLPNPDTGKVYRVTVFDLINRDGSYVKDMYFHPCYGGWAVNSEMEMVTAWKEVEEPFGWRPE